MASLFLNPPPPPPSKFTSLTNVLTAYILPKTFNKRPQNKHVNLTSLQKCPMPSLSSPPFLLSMTDYDSTRLAAHNGSIHLLLKRWVDGRGMEDSLAWRERSSSLEEMRNEGAKVDWQRWQSEYSRRRGQSDDWRMKRRRSAASPFLPQQTPQACSGYEVMSSLHGLLFNI